MNLIFICSRNKWRSPTAEAIFRNSQRHQARSAGTSASARVKVNETMIDWADLIFVMEQRHRQLLQERFAIDKKIIVLDIEDDYQFMDDELVDMIKNGVAPYLNFKSL